MKKSHTLILASTLSLSVFFCGQKKEKTTTEDYGTPQTETVAPAASNAVAQGESLMKVNDCKTCHHVTNKIIGPAYTDVAKKYEFTADNVKLLASKVIKGGTGVWGQIPMTPHSDLSEGDAEMMVSYVLSLDGEKEH